MMIAFNTGLRCGEVLRLTWDNINFDNQTLKVEKIISFRHTHATLLLENGAIDKAIQERFGHARIAIIMDTTRILHKGHGRHLQ